MLLRKESGGTAVKWRGAEYEWREDGSVTDVPVELAEDLLSIRGAGYSEVPPGEDPGQDGADEDPGGADGTVPKAPRRKAAAKEPAA